jgi:hypothetical protein
LVFILEDTDAFVPHSGDGSFGSVSFLFGKRVTPHDATASERSNPMARFKDINACIALLQALHAGNDIEPKQKKNVEAAIVEAKRLRRKRTADGKEAHRCVRRITENLLKAFMRD